MSQGRIPLAVPVVGAAEAANLQACIDTTFVSSVGPFVTEFERQAGSRPSRPRPAPPGCMRRWSPLGSGATTW